MSVGSHFLLSSALSKVIAFAVVGTTAIAVPAVLSGFSAQKQQSFRDNAIQPLSKQSEEWYKALEHITTEGGDKILETYNSTYTDVSNELNADVKKVGKELHKGEKAVSHMTPYLTKDYIESYNYHSFVNREIINAIFKYLPTIFRDSIKDGTMEDGENYEMLNFRKIIHIINHSKFNALVASLSKLGSHKYKVLNETTTEDAQGLMEVLRNLPFEEGDGQHDDKSSPRLDKFIETVIKNVDDINSDQTRSYTTAKDLIIDILIGKNAEKETKENLQKVIDQLKAKTKTLTEEIPVESAQIEQAKAILDVLQKILEAKKD